MGPKYANGHHACMFRGGSCCDDARIANRDDDTRCPNAVDERDVLSLSCCRVHGASCRVHPPCLK